jgi:ankyrin repeat protein
MSLIRDRRSDSHFMSQHVIRLLINNLVYYTTLEEQIEDLKTLLALGADANFVSDDGWTPLATASYNGTLSAVELLVKNNAEITASGMCGCTPLNAAAKNGHIKVVKRLLEKGADISGSASDGWTPLSEASSNGHLEVVELLLSQGADPLVFGQNGYSTLDTAAANGHVEIVKTLLAHESFNTVHEKRSHCGTIANTMAYYGHTDLLQYIVQHKDVDLQIPDRLNRTPLLFAATGGRVQTFEYLVDYGLPLGTLDAKGDGLISCFLRQSTTSGFGSETRPQV